MTTPERERIHSKMKDFFSKKIGPEEFAKEFVEWMDTPDHARYEAEQASKRLKEHKEGREYLLTLIKKKQEEGAKIDYEFRPINGGDSICVTLNGRMICFPYFFPKEFIDMNWKDLTEERPYVITDEGRVP